MFGKFITTNLLNKPFIPQQMQCRQIMLNYSETDKSGTANDILKPIIQDVMQCKYPPEKKKEPKYPWPLLPPIRNLKNSGVFQGTQV